MKVIGVISDTHGVLRASAVEALRGAELVLHAGDIGSFGVIDGLQALAPVTAVRGNCDHGTLAAAYPAQQRVEIEGIVILLLHDRKELPHGKAPAGVHVVVSGHTHKASLEQVDGVMYLNPGSAGRKRFSLPITVARLKFGRGTVTAEIVQLEE